LSDKLDHLADASGKSRSAVIRALIKQATTDDLPAAWTKVGRKERLYLKDIEG
jgi:predicted transcriptional regulator